MLSRFRFFAVFALIAISAGAETLKGWLSDEGCARGRVASGIFTGTNPECARECVAKGKRIVLIDAEHKAMLDVENQDAAREYVGDYVEIAGRMDTAGKAVHVDSVKLLEKGVAKCSRVRPKSGR